VKRKLILFAAAIWLSAVAAQAADRKDLQIADDIAAAVNRYPNFTIFDDVTVDVRSGIAVLGGKVTMPYKREEIAKRVANVDGVREIQNLIGVLPASSWDDELRYRIARAIYGNSNFSNYATMANPPIHIIVEHGRVILTGVVQSNVDRMLARSLATNFDAFSVTSQLRTDAEVRESLEQGIVDKTE
jgi:BON domain